MESIEQVIGADRMLELKFDSRNLQLSAEDWTASLRSLQFHDDGDLFDDSELLASARLVRVSMLDGDWLDSLDAESGDLQAVGAAFVEWDRIADLDEASAFADSLVVIDFISVPEKHRGSRLSEVLARGIGHVFRNEIVALIPDELSSDDGKLYVDSDKKKALQRHWQLSGFVQIPGTDVMFLPIGGR